MATLFASPNRLSIYAYAEDGTGRDLRKGTHLRLFTGHGDGFPLTPFVVFKLASKRSEPQGLHVIDRSRIPITNNANLPARGVSDVIPILGDDDQRRTVRLELIPSDPAGLKRAVLLDQAGRAIAERHAPRWLFSAPALHWLRLQGQPGDIGLRTSVVDVSQIIEGRLQPALILGLPIEGAHHWYVGGQSRAVALSRVEDGAPLRLNNMDRPEGPFDAVGGADETRRVEAMLKATPLGGGLEAILARLIDDDSLPPWAQMEAQELIPGPMPQRQTVVSPRASTLQLAALDPGLARFFGWAAFMDSLPNLDGNDWDTLAVVGLFATASRKVPGRRQQADGEAALIDLLVRAIADAGGQDIRSDLDRIVDQVRERGLQVKPVIAVTSPTPPWDPPSLPPPDIIDLRWQPPTDGTPSKLYRAGFAFSDHSLTTLAAVSAKFGGDWVTRHAPLSVPGAVPDLRRQPMMFGRETRPAARARRSSSASLEPASLLAEQNLPATSGEITYRVRASDLFGRFGPPVKFTVAAPPRPAPPPPALRQHFERTAIDLDSLAPQIPGVIKVLVGPGDVPGIDDLAAGSLVIEKLELSIAGTSQVVDVTVPGTHEVTLPLGPLGPQEHGSWTLTGIFRDTDGTPSKPTVVKVSARDIRSPAPYPTGVGLFWTSMPGPSPDVELRLSWPAAKDSEHRVYLTDEHGLGLTDADLADAQPAIGPSRGRVAVAGCRKVLEHRPVAREGFRLLTDPPIKAGADGRALFETLLPRSLSTVQFLRIVPLGPDGAEPPFEACGIVPVAVPDAYRPPPPVLDGWVDRETGAAKLTVSADGFDRTTLRRDEPGLFTAGEHGANPPHFRIRRAVGAVPDPIYARRIAESDLTRDPDTEKFVAEHADVNAGAGLAPFVRYVYWAEVRLPPERRLPADVNPVDPAGGITPVNAAGSKDSPRLFSLPSAPRILMHTPQSPPEPPTTVEIVRQPRAGGFAAVTITITDPPRAHKLAIDRYRLAIWSQWFEAGTGLDILIPADASGKDLKGIWPSVEDGTVSVAVVAPVDLSADATLELRLAFVDPLGRLSELKNFNAP
ncbi:hypothetical protein [Rhizobium sp. LEGMi135b]